ncbi:MAG: hypothetical protein BJ554DRAFT_2381 [Olpidium bornovanus]|uniref:Uncharacterized protein n=1 Tax=Olpidium bornovanus TaxID=278681 RepID=A0A8H8DGG4_9FUNG|nr:MAG: hypothetical protein BJ554DRAFT_2381 [Olpidium bornovanus]
MGSHVRGPPCPRSRRRLRPSTASRPLICAFRPPPFALRPPSPAACLPWRRSTGGLRAVLQHTSGLGVNVLKREGDP